MIRPIRSLDFNALMRAVRDATIKGTGGSRDPLMHAQLQYTPPHQRSQLLRDHLVIAACHGVQRIDEITIERPIVEALVRVQHHPTPPSFPVPTYTLDHGVEAGTHLSKLVEAHPELAWEIDVVEGLLVRAVQAHGDQDVHLLADRQPPWLMYWGPAQAAASALWMFVTLRELGYLA